MLDAGIGGLRPGVYHLTNIILHISVTFLLYQLLLSFKYRDDIALILSFLFLVHPLNVQAVAWIPGRNDSLLAFWSLISFYCFLKYLKYDGIWWISIAGVSYFLGLLTKETAAVMPVILFSFVILENKFRKSSLIITFSVLTLASMVWLIMRYNAMNLNSVHSTGYLKRKFIYNGFRFYSLSVLNFSVPFGFPRSTIQSIPIK